MTEQIEKIVDNLTTGEGTEFYLPDRSIKYKFVINGNAGAAIDIYKIIPDRELNSVLFSIKCANFGDATIELFHKTNHDNDLAFRTTGDIYASEQLVRFRN